jgi:hypothetical protein
LVPARLLNRQFVDSLRKLTRTWKVHLLLKTFPSLIKWPSPIVSNNPVYSYDFCNRPHQQVNMEATTTQATLIRSELETRMSMRIFKRCYIDPVLSTKGLRSCLLKVLYTGTLRSRNCATDEETQTRTLLRLQDCESIYRDPDLNTWQVFALVHWYYVLEDINALCEKKPAQRKKWQLICHRSVP